MVARAQLFVAPLDFHVLSPLMLGRFPKGWLSWMTAGDDDPDKSWHAWWIQQNAVSDLVVRRATICNSENACNFALLALRSALVVMG